jgi:starch phosphorylase
VAGIHTKLLRQSTLRDFAEMFPARFNNKTNGVTPRRWLLCANPAMAQLVSEAIGDKWITDLDELRKIVPLGGDGAFCAKFMEAERVMKVRLVDWLKRIYGHRVDPDTIFDCHVKRIHEYKRQLLNVLHIVVLYNRLRGNPNFQTAPRTFFFAGKAAPGYRAAKLVIRLIHNIAAVIDRDPAVRGMLKVVFLPDYNVTLAERLIPGADVSEQISTAGYEASGTSNMKFMMNGALTIGTRDGATIEIAEEAGEDNVFLFGLTADQVAESRPWYSPWWHVENEPETRQALDLMFSDHFCKGDSGVFEPIRGKLLAEGDFYMHLADLKSYTAAQERVADLWSRPNEWARKAIVNIGSSGKFSSDRTIRQYASEIWGAKPYPQG